MRGAFGFIIAAVIIVASPAQSQQKPCQRGQNISKPGGTELDEMKCAIAIAISEAKTQAQAQIGRLIELEANNRMLDSDLATARMRVDDMEKYAKACGDKPGCWLPVSPSQ